MGMMFLLCVVVGYFLYCEGVILYRLFFVMLVLGVWGVWKFVYGIWIVLGVWK